MSFSKEKLPKGQPISQYPELVYARNLFRAFLDRPNVLQALGYDLDHQLVASEVLSNINRHGRVHTKPQPRATFQSRIETVEVSLLRRGGYYLDALYYPEEEELVKLEGPEERLTYALQSEPSMIFYDIDCPQSVASFRMVPEWVGLEDIHKLTKHLYEGTEGIDIHLSLHERDRLTANLDDMISAVSTYRTWWESNQKDILSVVTNFEGKALSKRPRTIADNWLRYPLIEFQGRKWIPFGNQSSYEVPAEYPMTPEKLI